MHGSTDTGVRRAVGLCGPAVPGDRVVGHGEAFIQVGLVGSGEYIGIEIPAEAVRSVVCRRRDVEGVVCEGSIDDTTVISNTVAAETRIHIPHDGCSQVVCIFDFIPIPELCQSSSDSTSCVLTAGIRYNCTRFSTGVRVGARSSGATEGIRPVPMSFQTRHLSILLTTPWNTLDWTT